MKFNMPVRIVTGIGCVCRHSDDICSFGNSALIVTGKHSAVSSGALDDIIKVLSNNGIRYTVYSSISSNPSVASCIEGGKIACENGADFVIGIGGGSPLDAAKAIAVFASNPDIDEDSFYKVKWDNDPLPIILIGTTSGTGSEVTNVSVLTDSAGRKHSIHENRMYAAVSFGDPGYTYSMSRDTTASTGIDIVAHCTESYFSKKATPESRFFALAGMKNLRDPLSRFASGQAPSEEDRAKLYYASLFGGLAISVTGTCFPHNMGYYLTEKYGVPHGYACAEFLPEFIRHVCDTDPVLAERFFGSLGLGRYELTDLVRRIVPDDGPVMTKEEVDSIVPRWENNNSVKNTIGSVPVDEIKNILSKFIKG